MATPATNQEVIIDLTKATDIADAVADMEPGDEVCLYGTIKSLDDQTLVVTVQELDEPEDENTDADKAKPLTGNEGSGDVTDPGASGMGAMDSEDAAV